MTWGGFLSRLLGVILILPLVLTRLSTAEISLWYLFMTFIGLQQLVTAGFSSTFSRVLSYSSGGAHLNELQHPESRGSGAANWKAIEAIFSTMGVVYLRLAVIWLALLGTLGTYFLIRPMEMTNGQEQAWLAWLVILGTSIVTVFGDRYSAFLHGINKVALLQRWNILTSIGSIASSIVVLVNGGGLLELAIANQIWAVLLVIRNRWLARVIVKKELRDVPLRKIDAQVLRAIWPSTWRSAIGIFSGYGLLQLSGIAYAQLATTAEIASYLLALRLIQAISQFSQAPFYSKLPLMARLHAEQESIQLISTATKGMRRAHWTFCLGFIAVGLLGNEILSTLESNADFPNASLWTLMGLAFFVQRYGAMHIQLYSLTNIIIWHISNGISGSIYLLLSIIIYPLAGVSAFPVALLIGNLSFHAWYPAMKSYQTFDLTFPEFEKKTSMLPCALIVSYAVLYLTYF